MFIFVRPIHTFIRVFSLLFVSMETLLDKEREGGEGREERKMVEQRMRRPIWSMNTGV